jgi:ATP-dependent DNA ligase
LSAGVNAAEDVKARPKLVVEVRHDHFSGGRFRHGTRLLRWRPDKGAATTHHRPAETEKTDLRALLG